MKVAVYGLWHLGCVTAACLAHLGHEVTGIETDEAKLQGLQGGKAPLFEPGLDDLLASGLKAGKLRLTPDLGGALRECRVLWVTFDTPVDEQDSADVEYVMGRVRACLPFLKPGAVVLISSQLPVGSTARLQADADSLRPSDGIRLAYCPENLRLGQAIEIFEKPDRIVVGVSDAATNQVVAELLAPLKCPVEWMSVASAEMVKHAVNSFLALSVVYMNEIAWLCERHGADGSEVERGLKTESRIGPRAYVRPGAAFAGGTLARDLTFLKDLSRQDGREKTLFEAALQSNAWHRLWPRQVLKQALGALKGMTVAVLGLAYKEGTSTLRRSEGLALARWLASEGADVRAYDPRVASLDEPLAGCRLTASLQEAIEGCQALVLMSNMPEYSGLSLADLASRNPKPVVVDPGGLLAGQKVPAEFSYWRVGYRPGKGEAPKLKGLKAVVTGANRGLGLAIVRAFAKEGADLWIGARDVDLLRREAEVLRKDFPSVSIREAQVDVSDGASVERFLKGVRGTWDKLDVLVNNAGIYGPKGPLHEVQAEEWIKAVNINLFGVVRMCQGCLKMLQAAEGRVVNLSGGGATSPMPNLSAYAASKAAVVRLTETLALEWKPLGVEVNAVAPGALNTRMLDEVLEAGPGKVGQAFYDKALRQKAEGGASLSIGAELCVYLASKESKGVTGRLISAVWDPWADLAFHTGELENSDIYTLRRIVPEDRGKDWT